MKKIIASSLNMLIFGVLLFNMVAPVQAGILEKVEDGGLTTIGSKAYDQAGTPRDIQGIVAQIIYTLLGFLGLIFVVLIVWSGYEWMTSQGDPAKVTKAKDRLTNSVIGLVVVLAAYGIALFIMEKVVNVTGTVTP